MIDKLTNFALFFPLLTATLDLNSKFDIFYNELDRIYTTCCPTKIKEISEKRLKKPWLSSQLLGDIQNKYELFKRYKNGSIPYEQFLAYQKDLRRKIKMPKNNTFCTNLTIAKEIPPKHGSLLITYSVDQEN